jgi:Zn-dependent M28 family amino/carboxypeptidase
MVRALSRVAGKKREVEKKRGWKERGVWVLSALSLCLFVVYLAAARPFVLSYEPVSLAHRADPEQLKHHVKKLSEDFRPRDFLHPEVLEKAASYISEELAATGVRVERQRFTAGKYEYSNVIAYHGAGVGPPVLIGAHYDTFEELPGADDNASGVAGLIELGRLLHRKPVRVPVTLVAYSLEEPPFFRSDKMGSAVHAESLVERGDDIRLMISLETIGFFTDDPGSQQYPHPILKLFYPDQGNFIAVVGNMGLSSPTVDVKRAFLESTDLPVYSLNAPASLPGVDFSDHLSYWNHGFEAVMITDTAMMRNTRYHTADDTVGTLDYNRMAKVVEGVYRYLDSLV